MTKMSRMKNSIQHSINEAKRALQQLESDTAVSFIESVALLLSEVLDRRSKILIAGNGGSLCDAMHFAEEFTGRYKNDRKPIPAVAISDPSYITCTANDYGFDQIFSRYVEGVGKENDVLLAISTSGNSQNVINAAKVAKAKIAKAMRDN